jgi:hypothetical protein
MAILASCSVDQSIVPNGRKVSVVLAVANTGGSALTVTSIQPVVEPSRNNAAANVPLTIGSNTTVAAGGTTYFAWTDVFRVNLQNGVPQFFYRVGATVTTSDGTVTAATQATVQVIATQTTTPTSPGAPPYTPSPGPVPAITEAAPLPGEDPNLPLGGQLRFESNLNSGLLDVVLTP